MVGFGMPAAASRSTDVSSLVRRSLSKTWYTTGTCASLSSNARSTAVSSRRSDSRTRKSVDPRPNARSASIASATISASARWLDSPIRSQLSWKCSRSLPRCCRS